MTVLDLIEELEKYRHCNIKFGMMDEESGNIAFNLLPVSVMGIHIQEIRSPAGGVFDGTIFLGFTGKKK